MKEQNNNEIKNLGGTRQSKSLENEMTYPLTNDEFHLIKENISLDKFNSIESILLSTAITTLISAIIFFFTNPIIQKTQVDNNEIIATNNFNIIVIIIYFSLGFGSLIGFFISIKNKKKNINSYNRLENKINKTLNI